MDPSIIVGLALFPSCAFIVPDTPGKAPIGRAAVEEVHREEHVDATPPAPLDEARTLMTITARTPCRSLATFAAIITR